MLFRQRGDGSGARQQRVPDVGVNRLKVNGQTSEGRVEFGRRHREEKSMSDVDAGLAYEGEAFVVAVVFQAQDERFHPGNEMLAVVILEASKDAVTFARLQKRKIH